MSRLATTLSGRLEKVQARIAEIETEYPKIIKIKSYSVNFSAQQTAYQDFGAVAKEYRALLDDEERISAQLDALEETTPQTTLASFRSPC